MTHETTPTAQVTLNMGPQHPSTHGVLRLELLLEGEVILDCKPVIGYLHRGIERIAEARTYPQFLPYTDRVDYLSSASNNLAYVQPIERLLGLEVPERAQYLRVILLELNRIASHLVFIATFANDLGATSAFLYGFREREAIMDLFEMWTGAPRDLGSCRQVRRSHLRRLPKSLRTRISSINEKLRPTRTTRIGRNARHVQLMQHLT